jgi:DNA-binding response OmpR family regulator
VRAAGQSVLHCDDLMVDIDGGRVVRGGRELALTPIEYRLLLLLLQHKGQAMDEEAIAERLWGDTGAATTSNRVEVHVHRLRGKLQQGSETPLLHTLRAFGRSATYVVRGSTA